MVSPRSCREQGQHTRYWPGRQVSTAQELGYRTLEDSGRGHRRVGDSAAARRRAGFLSRRPVRYPASSERRGCVLPWPTGRAPVAVTGQLLPLLTGLGHPLTQAANILSATARIPAQRNRDQPRHPSSRAVGPASWRPTPPGAAHQMKIHRCTCGRRCPAVDRPRRGIPSAS